MSDDATSLARLHDIIEPPAAAWWPLAPGWQVVLALGALLLVVGSLRLLIHRQRNCYRREAQRELRHLMADRHRPANDRARLAAMAALLKRTAKTAFPDERVAGSTGDEWFAFLDRTGGTRFGDGLGQALERANYVDNADWGEPQLDQLAKAVQYWIREHRAPLESRGKGNADQAEAAA